MTPSSFRGNFERLHVMETLKIMNSNCEEEDCDWTLSNEVETTIEIVEDSPSESEYEKMMNGMEKLELNRRLEDLQAVHNYAAKEQDRARIIVYFAGYLFHWLKQTNSNRSECLNELTASAELLDHLFTQFKAYSDGDERFLQLASKELIGVVEKVVNRLTGYVEALVFTDGVKRRMLQELDDIGFDFLPDCHGGVVRLRLVGMTIGTTLNAFLKREREQQSAPYKKKEVKYRVAHNYASRSNRP